MTNVIFFASSRLKRGLNEDFEEAWNIFSLKDKNTTIEFVAGPVLGFYIFLIGFSLIFRGDLKLTCRRRGRG